MSATKQKLADEAERHAVYGEFSQAFDHAERVYFATRKLLEDGAAFDHAALGRLYLIRDDLRLHRNSIEGLIAWWDSLLARGREAFDENGAEEWRKADDDA